MGRRKHDETARLGRLYAEGRTLREVAEVAGISVQALRERFIRAGIKTRVCGRPPCADTWNAAIDAVLAILPDAPEAVALLKR